MGKPRGSTSPLHGAMNIISSLLLCLTFGRLVIVLYRYFETSSEITGNNRVPFWFPPPQPHGGKGPLTQKYHRLHASSQLTAYGAGRRGEAMPAELEMQLSNLRESHAFFGDSQRSNVRLWDRTITKEGFGYSSSSSSSVRGVSGSATGSGVASPTYAWGRGMKVLVCAVDAMHENAVGSTSVLAAENMLRESLTDTLIEAGVQVDFAVSDAELEMRDGASDLYSAILVDPRTWAEKGGRLFPRFTGRQARYFLLDPFGLEKSHPNLGVPPVHHLTAFPVPVSQHQTFLGVRVGASRSKALRGKPVMKRRQGVVYGTAAAWNQNSARTLISKLTGFVELHSTVAPQDAKFWHKNIMYHGHLSPTERQQLLRESRFIIDLDGSTPGQFAVEAILAGCAYISPTLTRPMEGIYSPQQYFLAQNAGDEYVCSFEQKDRDSAVECARTALERELPPLMPPELTKEAHATKVKRIFEPLAVAAIQ